MTALFIGVAVVVVGGPLVGFVIITVFMRCPTVRAVRREREQRLRRPRPTSQPSDVGSGQILYSRKG
jgi:hypothetical protein